MAHKVKQKMPNEDYEYYECSDCRSVVAFSDPRCPNCGEAWDAASDDEVEAQPDSE